MNGLDWQSAVKDIEASVNWLKTTGSSNVRIAWISDLELPIVIIDSILCDISFLHFKFGDLLVVACFVTRPKKMAHLE